MSELITDENWRLHPDWVYCQYNYAGDRAMEFDSPEETFRHFVAKSQTPGWTWGTPRVRPLPKCTNRKNARFDPNCLKCKSQPASLPPCSPVPVTHVPAHT